MGSTPLSNRYRVDANHRDGSYFFVRQLRPARAAPTTATRARNRGISVRAAAKKELLKRPCLAKTSPAAMRCYAMTCGAIHQSGRRDSNARHSAWKADALPLSYARGGLAQSDSLQHSSLSMGLADGARPVSLFSFLRKALRHRHGCPHYLSYFPPSHAAFDSSEYQVADATDHQ